jgi:hypothetical protein
MTKAELAKMISNDPELLKRVGKVLKDYNAGCEKALPVGEEHDEVGKDDLTTEGREHISEHNFALPAERKYPIHDLAHARNALARASGKPEEEKVRAAVYSKYPALKERSEKSDMQLGQGPLDDAAQAALSAVTRILHPLKDKLSPVLLTSVLNAAGFDLGAAKSEGEEMEHMEPMEHEKSAHQSPEPIKEEHKIEAMKVAKDAHDKAYKAHLAKLGYQKYPTEQMQQKDVNHDPDEPSQDEEQEGLMHNPDHEDSGDFQHKSVMKSLKGLPKEAQLAVEQIFKSHQDTKMRLEAVTKAARKKDFIEKAKGYKHLGVSVEDLANTLEELPSKQLEVVEKMLRAADEQISKGKLYSEFGSSQSNPAIQGPEASWANIQKAAHGYVAKSGQKVSDAEAINQYLQTDEGKKMYTDYNEELRAAARRA